MIFARFSTPGTFPRKLRGEFRAPFSAAGCSRFSALYLNARRISRAGGNALLKSAIFYPIFPSYFLALRSPSRPPCLVCVRAKLLRSFVNCFRATRTRKPTCEWMKRRTKERKTTGGENFSRERVGKKLTFSPLAPRSRKKETSRSRSALRILQAQVYTSELWPEKSEVRGRKVAAECLACDAHNKVAGMRLGETFVGTRK